MAEAKVTLLSWTEHPVETIYTAWEASRHNRPVRTPAALATDIRAEREGNWVHEGPPLGAEVEGVFQKVIESKIPVAEMVDFVFLLENVSIAFREQMVRHRIGVKVGERLGTDIVPDLADSTWWSQSMRILDMGQFASEGAYEIPEGVDLRKVEDPVSQQFNLTARQAYREFMMHAQLLYKALADAGVPLEEARLVIPLAATHRIVWKLNLAALQHIIGKRGCWILQLGFWGPVIKGMVNELATRVHPGFRSLINPPCIRGDRFHECLFKHDNERRIDGEDEIPPCPLYLNHHKDEALRAVAAVLDRKGEPHWRFDPEQRLWNSNDAKARLRMNRMENEYTELWHRNVDTGVSCE